MLQFPHPTLSLPSPSKLRTSASVIWTAAVCTPLKRLYSMHKVTKGLTLDPAWHTTSAELGSHQPHLLVGRGRHHSATKHSPWDAIWKRSVGMFLITDCGGFAVSSRRFHTPIRSELHSRESPSIGSSLTFKDKYHSHAALSFIQFTHSLQALIDPFSAPLPGAHILLHAWG